MGNCFVSSAKLDGVSKSHSSSVETKDGRGSSSPTSSSATSSFTLSSTSRAEILATPRSEQDILSSSNLKAFSFSELKNATKNFSADNLIGEGGFGYVYKGWLNAQSLVAARPGSGMVVAVKKLKPEGFQGHKEWLAEVLYLGQLHHPNLVKLIGYCSQGDNRLLVYEYMTKGNLESYLFRRSGRILTWATRMKIAAGAARGLEFLHNAESQVIYRDLKAANILLDDEFNPKLSDFGLAKAGPTGDNTHVSTRVMGTPGYAAPEYIATGRLSAKADVYSFGVMLLEMMSGRQALDMTKAVLEQKLVDWAKPHLEDKRSINRIMDTKLEGKYPKKGMLGVAALASICLSNNAKLRPSMSEVLTKLEQLQATK